MALITENCPLVALIKSRCVSRKVLTTEAGKAEHRVSCLWSFILSAGPVGPTGGQMVSGIRGHRRLERGGFPVLTSIWQTARPKPGRCGVPLGASGQ